PLWTPRIRLIRHISSSPFYWLVLLGNALSTKSLRANGSTKAKVAVFCQCGDSLPIEFRVRWCPGSQSIDIAVHHAELRSNQDGVMNFKICGTLGTCILDVFGGYMFAALLHLPGNDEQSFQLLRNVCGGEISFDLVNELLIAAQVMCSDGT